MTQAVEILTELQRRGVTVAVEGDTLCLKPRRALDDALLARLREAKPAILKILRESRPDTYKASTAAKVEAAEPWGQAEVTCWHCQGEGRCGCTACWKRYAGEIAECVVCQGTGKVAAWVQ